jgi:hypothetical protein
MTSFKAVVPANTTAKLYLPVNESLSKFKRTKGVKSAHYPQDPAFMDACDELGMFIIVATPGWQFWNKEPVFEERVYSYICNMVRRDRNHPLEKIQIRNTYLNETKTIIQI